MIKYALRCDHLHNWDAWFPSISAYDDQNSRGLVECPYCSSKMVEKAPMAPSIISSKLKSPPQSEPTTDAVKPEQEVMPIATPDMSLALPEPLKAMLTQMKERIEKTHDYVGDTFAREVRAMHEGETDERPIYGQSTASEVKALLEDDIPVTPLPIFANPKGVKGLH